MLLPMYLYHTAELPKKGDGTLFHFTKVESFFKILEDLTLVSSSFRNLNDLNEGNIHNMNMNKNFRILSETEKYINENCHIISFAQNYEIEGFGFEGTNHPAMWGHYAENSEGVCIVIDKEAFIKQNVQILNDHFWKFEDVSYSFFNTPNDKDIDYKVNSVQEFIKRNWKKLFFLKHRDWANEDEHRLFIMGYNGKFTIKGCIKYIVLGRKFFFNDARIKRLIDIFVNPQSCCYKMFVPHSFATMCYHTHGYMTHEIAFKIHSLIKLYAKSDDNYKLYNTWLHDNYNYEL